MQRHTDHKPASRPHTRRHAQARKSPTYGMPGPEACNNPLPRQPPGKQQAQWHLRLRPLLTGHDSASWFPLYRARTMILQMPQSSFDSVLSSLTCASSLTVSPKQMMTGLANSTHTSRTRMNRSHLVRPSGRMRPLHHRRIRSAHESGLQGRRAGGKQQQDQSSCGHVCVHADMHACMDASNRRRYRLHTAGEHACM
jgi:hypothetical protein